jgi:hydrogenase-4 component E
LRWGSSVKQLVLYVILLDVLVAPWGLAGTHRLGDVLLAIVILLGKCLATGAAVVVIESSFAKLRLYKIPEFTVASFMLAVLAVVIFLFEPSFGNQVLTVFGGTAIVISVFVLLAEYGMLRSQDAWEQLRLYSLSSVGVAVLAVVTAAGGHGSSSLYVLGAVTIALKALLFPIGIRFVLRNLEVDPQLPSTIGVPSSILLAILLSGFSFVVLRDVHVGAEAALPLSALPVAVAGVLVAFLLMILRPHASSQLVGFLVLENAVSLATLVIAPGLPLVLALLLLFDVLIGVIVFVVLVQYLAVERTAVRTDILDRLSG